MLDQLKNDTLLIKTVDTYLKRHYWNIASFYQIFKLNQEGDLLQIKEGFEVYICSENIEIIGLVASCGGGITLVHFLDERVMNKYSLLKTLLALRPTCLKGDPRSVEMAKKILEKSTLDVVDESYTWMAYEFQGSVEEKRQELLTQLEDYGREGLEIQTARDLDFQSLIPFLIEVEKCFNRNPLSINQLKKKMNDRVEMDAYLLASWKGAVVGQGLLEYALPNHKLLGGIYVAKSHRRRGLARLMTSSLVQVVLELDKGPALTVEVGNEGALKLYESLGFYACGKQQNSYIKLRA